MKLCRIDRWQKNKSILRKSGNVPYNDEKLELSLYLVGRWHKNKPILKNQLLFSEQAEINAFEYHQLNKYFFGIGTFL